MTLSFSTGITSLDKVLHGILPGDNIVFQIYSINDYIPFVHAFCNDNEKKSRTLIYFRFADHQFLLPDNVEAKIIELHPEEGFEHFINEIFTVIEKFGHGICYVFDSLSELSVDWYSDRMLANFFMLTCPFLYEYETVTYFALQRGRHSQYTISKIHNTAQIILDIYNKDEKIYIYPIKVWKRHSPTMYMLHIWKDDEFIPVLKSALISEILLESAENWSDFSSKTSDLWYKTFDQAYRLLMDIKSKPSKTGDLELLKERIIRMIITRDPKLYSLVKKYFDLHDLLSIGRRMIGTGLIGGKSVGMLLAQAILKKLGTKWPEKLETHDSFFIGSDVFYTYLVINNCWWIRHKILRSENFLELASKARLILAKGKFPDDVIDQFKNMLNYFGQSPIIVRSSSLLEDTYGNSFSGKYDSVFLANQGTPEQRLLELINAVKTIYISTMSDDALIYRASRNLLDKDEQMAILVQRVSGSSYGNLFYPQLAGVGYSFNPFVWNKDIKPEAGLTRLVFGLGTRAVDRCDDDYTRIVALNAPYRRPEANLNDKYKYNQNKVDVLDLKNNKFTTKYFDEVVLESKGLPIEFFGTRNYDIEEKLKSMGKDKVFYNLDLDKFILKSPIIKDMQEIMHKLAEIYNYPVDIEFTINFIDENRYKIYILQCRPFQIKSGVELIDEPRNLKSADILLKTNGPIIGNGIVKIIDRIIYVVPKEYSKLSIQERYGVARLIGKLNRLQKNVNEKTIFLIGPGRWATLSPSLGVPVSFQEINNISIICEIAEMHENLCPDVSLGTHFFNDLVENNMLYIAIYPRKKGSILNREKFNLANNNLVKLIPNSEKFEHVVKVIDNKNIFENKKIKIYSDSIKQIAILFLEP
ncbi:MAG: PEP/pyruvate-binding domain-containing protein [Candidatus Helarchaeota archaeon]